MAVEVTLTSTQSPARSFSPLRVSVSPERDPVQPPVELLVDPPLVELDVDPPLVVEDTTMLLPPLHIGCAGWSLPLLYAVWALALLSLGAWFLFLWRIPQVLMKTATRCGRGRVAVLALYLPAHWLMMAFVVALGAMTIGFAIGAAFDALLDALRI